jgi:hypothetical protein
MKFEPVETTARHKVYRCSDDTVLHDTRRLEEYTQREIIDATLEALDLPGSIGVQLEEALKVGTLVDGVKIQNTHLYHNKVESVNPGITVSSTQNLTPEQTQALAREFLSRGDER